MTAQLDHRTLYRLPWTLPDNAISWLEPTFACNLYCEGCYRTNDPKGHKTLEAIGHDLDVFTRLRSADGISVAGGDPLCHPLVVDIVAMIAQRGLKPILNTNGLALSRELLTEMKRAGLWGLTLHIDSKQTRPKWRGKSEVELNELRLQYAQMIAEVSGLSCSFNSTVYEDTLEAVPDIVAWGEQHIDIVHVLVFIAFRSAQLDSAFDHWVNGRKLDTSHIVDRIRYATDEQPTTDILSTDILAVIQERFPEFQPSAYLNGTEKPDSFKWLLAGRLGTKGKIHGYVGPRFMELAQVTHHLRHGRYLAYSSPKVHRRGRAMLTLSPVDRSIARTARAYLSNPLRALKRLHYQSVMIIQPIDILPDGRQNMCDGCPDMTVWNGRLAWSCRLEEPMNFGSFVQTVPKQAPEAK